MECTAARLDGSFLGRRGPICFVLVHSLSMSRSHDLALLPRCCSISVSRPSKPAAFPAFNRLRPVASSSRLKGVVSSVGGWLLLERTELTLRGLMYQLDILSDRTLHLI